MRSNVYMCGAHFEIEGASARRIALVHGPYFNEHLQRRNGYIRTSFHIIIHHISSGALQTAQLSGFSEKISEIISKIISDCRCRLPIEQSHFVLVIFHEHIGFALISFAVAWITKCTSSFGYLAFLASSMGVSGLIASFISSSCGPLIDFSCSSQEKVP